MLKRNWKTSIVGLLGGLLPLLTGILEKDPSKISAGLAIIFAGLFAKDHDATI